MSGKFPYSEFFWSVFSRIRTECGEIRSISSYSVRMRENTDQKNSEYRRIFFERGQYLAKINILYSRIRVEYEPDKLRIRALFTKRRSLSYCFCLLVSLMNVRVNATMLQFLQLSNLSLPNRNKAMVLFSFGEEQELRASIKLSLNVNCFILQI